jgi:carboxylesterase
MADLPQPPSESPRVTDQARSEALWLPGAAAQPCGVLLVHGFSGSPYELHLLAAVLHQRGYHVAVPRLAGHHRSLRALADSRYPDWLASADEAFLALWARIAEHAAERPRVAVLGLSMGGLLTAELAHRYPAATAGAPSVAAVGMLASPLWLSPRSERAIRLLNRVPGLRRLFVPKVAGSDLLARDLAPHRLRPRGMPLLALGSLLDLMAQARRHLPEIRQPALLVHGENDHTAPYACLAAFAAELGTPSEQLTCLSLPRSYHQVLLDVEREVVFDAVLSHLARHLARHPGAPPD